MRERWLPVLPEAFDLFQNLTPGFSGGWDTDRHDFDLNSSFSDLSNRWKEFAHGGALQSGGLENVELQVSQQPLVYLDGGLWKIEAGIGSSQNSQGLCHFSITCHAGLSSSFVAHAVLPDQDSLGVMGGGREDSESYRYPPFLFHQPFS